MSIFVALDSGGFVGAFLTKEDAIAKTVKKYHMPVALWTYPLAPPPVAATHVYVLPAVEGNIPAYVSNSLTKIREVQKALVHVGIAIDDDIECWRQPVGQISYHAQRRWEFISKGIKFDKILEEKLLGIVEPEVTILQCLEPTLVQPDTAVPAAASPSATPSPANTAPAGAPPPTTAPPSAAGAPGTAEKNAAGAPKVAEKNAAAAEGAGASQG